MSQHLIEAKLTPECRADVVFSHQFDPDWNSEIEIIEVLPFGIVPAAASLIDLAYDWLHKGGGYDACCRLAEERYGRPE